MPSFTAGPRQHRVQGQQSQPAALHVWRHQGTAATVPMSSSTMHTAALPRLTVGGLADLLVPLCLLAALLVLQGRARQASVCSSKAKSCSQLGMLQACVQCKCVQPLHRSIGAADPSRSRLAWPRAAGTRRACPHARAPPSCRSCTCSAPAGRGGAGQASNLKAQAAARWV